MYFFKIFNTDILIWSDTLTKFGVLSNIITFDLLDINTQYYFIHQFGFIYVNKFKSNTQISFENTLPFSVLKLLLKISVSFKIQKRSQQGIKWDKIRCWLFIKNWLSVGFYGQFDLHLDITLNFYVYTMSFSGKLKDC